MGFLEGKRALITGVASNRSIAWGCAKAMKDQGAEIALTYQNDKLKGRVEKFAEELGTDIIIGLDVATDEAIDAAFDELKTHWDYLDIALHSIAFAPKEELAGMFLDSVTREGFKTAHEISSYSFAAMANACRPMMKGRNGALMTMTYLGAERVVPKYNVMGLAKASLEANVRFMADHLGREGIRVNAISAGPIRTLAAAGISNFKRLLDAFEEAAPLGRCITIEEVGNVAAFMCSDLASGVTGEITYVDGGHNIIAGGCPK
ncbi:MAG: enoyl-ACP reductase [Gammaproteobacteria bacterium]|nr:enoyl-ACP reductase [Gammaproteobacteria bacterium]